MELESLIELGMLSTYGMVVNFMLPKDIHVYTKLGHLLLDQAV